MTDRADLRDALARLMIEAMRESAYDAATTTDCIDAADIERVTFYAPINMREAARIFSAGIDAGLKLATALKAGR